jgi:hypothetical protein
MDHLETQALYEDYKDDCVKSGVPPESVGEFVKQLRAVFPWSRRKRIPGVSGRPWGYTGLRWKTLQVPCVPPGSS